MADRESDTSTEPGPNRRAALLFVGALLGVLVVAGIVLLLTGGDDGGTSGTGGTTITCTVVPDDGGSEPCPKEVISTPAEVAVSTSEGDFVISLDVEASPATTTSFRILVENGFYDGLNFNRVVKGFVIQGGDPLSGDPQRAGSGGPGYYVDEPVPAGTTYKQGVVAMAKTATDPAGRSGSQFFVVSGADAGLPSDYAYVGKVSSGLETVKKIEALGVTDGPPRKEVKIDSMTVVPPGAS